MLSEVSSDGSFVTTCTVRAKVINVGYRSLERYESWVIERSVVELTQKTLEVEGKRVQENKTCDQIRLDQIRLDQQFHET
jgi:hypothetical protein